MITHAYRSTFFDRDVTVTLEASELVWRAGGSESSRLAYDRIARLTLRRPKVGGAGPRATHLLVDAANGHREVISRSAATGWFRQEDRAATFAPLVRELCRRVAAANPTACFEVGGFDRQTRRDLRTGTVVLLFMLAFIAAVPAGYAYWGTAMPASVILSIVGVSLSAFATGMTVLGNWRLIRQGPPHAFPPDAPPPDYLY